MSSLHLNNYPNDVISPKGKKPYPAHGGITILKGSLAPEGVVIKGAASEIALHACPARVVDSEEDAFDAMANGRIRKNDVVVTCY